MPLVAIIVGALLIIFGIGGALALNLFWLLVTLLGIALVIWGWHRIGWPYPGRRAGPPY